MDLEGAEVFLQPFQAAGAGDGDDRRPLGEQPGQRDLRGRGFLVLRDAAGQPDPDWLLRPEAGEGLALLERRGVPFDVISVLSRHLEHVPVLSERYPALRMVLDHLSHPPLGSDDWEPWRTLLRAAAANPLVYAKVSGLYPPRAGWAAADIRAYVEFAIELFGPGRLMFGSDWPVAELSGGYQRAWSAISPILGGLPPADRDAILGGTARAFYHLGEA